MSRAMGQTLSEYIWTVNDGMLRDHCCVHAGENTDVVKVRVLIESEDLIFEQQFASVSDAVTRREPVYRQGECIGYVEMSLSRAGVEQAQAISVRSSFLLTLGASLSMFLITTILRATTLT